MKRTSVLDYLKLRVLSCYKEAQMLKEGKMPPPRMAIVYPTYLCNHRCVGCDYTDLNKTKHSLTRTEFVNVTDQLIGIGIKGVEFCGGGEPTLHPHLPEIIDKLIANNISFGFLTNGTNLTPELRSRLVKHGSYCRISLEAASERVFNNYKRPVSDKASFENIIKNIKNLVKLRDSNRFRTRLQISIKYAIDRNNYKDVPAILPLADKLKVDSLQFKLIKNMPSQLKDAGTINSIKRKIGKVKGGYPRMIVVSDFEKSKLNTGCWLSPLQLVVDPFADVYICCYYRHRMKEHRLCNMLKTPLKNYWYSEDHWKRIGAIKKSGCNKYDCRFHHYNDLMQKLVIDDIGQLSFI